MKKKTLLLVGVGDLGYGMLHRFVRKPEISKIVAADKDEARARPRVDTALLSAIADGFHPDVDFTAIDLFNVEATAEKIKNIEPDMIFACPSLMAWWVYASELPPDVVAKVGPKVGPWLPMHLTLMYKLMQAVKKSGLKVGTDLHVVTSPFPDVTNVVLTKVGLGPTTGIGNIAEIVPYARLSVSQKLKVPVSNVTAFIIGHHSLDDAILDYSSSRGIPYILKCYVGGNLVTEDKLKSEEILSAAVRFAPGRETHPHTISVSMPVIMGIWNDTGELCHAPGPNGLPGGYPVRASAKGVEVFLPEGVTMQEAIRINQAGEPFDGVQEIRNDGTVVCTKDSVDVMKEVFGYDCRPLKPDETEARARELASCYKRTLEKLGRKSTFVHV